MAFSSYLNRIVNFQELGIWAKGNSSSRDLKNEILN